VAHTALGNLDAAEASATSAMANGVPPGRFAGGTLTGLEKLRPKLGLGSGSLVHGPVLGNLTGTSIDIWTRTAKAAKLQVSASESAGFASPLTSQIAGSTAESDFTAVVTLTDLKPNTTYHYRVAVDGKTIPQTHTFKTLAPAGSPAKFRIAFGGGAGYVPVNERAFDTIAAQKPDALFLLGDNVYSDDPGSPAMQHYCYYRRQSRPEFSRLAATVPTFSIWDDHDFGTNDCSGGPDPDLPAWKRPVWNVFQNNWPNPPYASTDANPGCYYDFLLGDVHFIMLDGRYHRDLKGTRNNGTPTMLGTVQRAWLLETIKNSTAGLRVLCSPVPWVYGAKGNSRDTWNGFKEERSQIFDFLTENKIPGVLLMSADRHRSDLWKIDRPGTYPLYEFNSSRLTNQHVHPEMKSAVFSYNKKQSFGLVDFDTTLGDPTISYSVLSIDGETVHSHTLNASQLR
ncbi:MAG: alkaline phosphatase D family protein, partial [Verrucomicrobiales bacterium]|nr:alkaline phosphatase D family protein [Verrucomicrobiales bacterium]